MGTLAHGGRITVDKVNEEIARLRLKWLPYRQKEEEAAASIANLLPKETVDRMDYYEKMTLSIIVDACRKSNSMAAAGRFLFDKSRQAKTSRNDSHRVKQILAKHQLTFERIKSLN